MKNEIKRKKGYSIADAIIIKALREVFKVGELKWVIQVNKHIIIISYF